MEKNDILFFKIISGVICSILVIGSIMYLTRNYKSHDQIVQEKADELRKAMDSVNEAIKNGDIKQFEKKK